MKSPISYFLLALTTLSITTTGSAQGPVLDMNGDAIFTGSYYVLPFVKNQGGGVTLRTKPSNLPCLIDIIQESSRTNEGLPVKFCNWNSKVGFVPLNSSLNIQTEVEVSECMKPTYWWVEWLIPEEEEEEKRTEMLMYLVAGPDPKEYQGDWWECGFFQIEEASDDKNVYKIVFCPGDLPRKGKVSKQPCGYVGIYVDYFRVRRLIFTYDEPFLVQFKKAEVIESVLSKDM